MPLASRILCLVRSFSHLHFSLSLTEYSRNRLKQRKNSYSLDHRPLVFHLLFSVSPPSILPWMGQPQLMKPEYYLQFIQFNKCSRNDSTAIQKLLWLRISSSAMKIRHIHTLSHCVAEGLARKIIVKHGNGKYACSYLFMN